MNKWLNLGALIGRVIRPFRSRRPALLVIRPGSLGDALLFTGALRALRQRFPSHRIVLVASRRAMPVFERSPYVDTVEYYDESAAADISLRRRVDRLAFAVRILGRAYAQLLDARIGPVTQPLDWAADLAARVCASQRLNLPPPDMHELDRLVVILQEAGCRSVRSRQDILPEHHLSEVDRRWATKRLAAIRTANRHRPILALCPGARFKQKAWGAANYTELLRLIAGDVDLSGMQVLFLGGAEDRDTVEAIMSEVVNDMTAMLNLVGQCTIHQTMAVIEQCDLCVGNDTFGLHAAIAVATPSVVLMWCGDGDRWIPWGDPAKHRMVRAEVDCGGCQGECEKPEHECMTSITPQMVIKEVKMLVKSGKRKTEN